MVNPAYSGAFSGFGVQIMSGLQSTVIAEKGTFAGNITISPGALSVTYQASNNFK